VTCREFADFMMEYLAGELAPDVLQAFERHLSLCPNCDTYLAQYRATVAAGREAFADDDARVPEEVPEDLIRAILAVRRSS
jgi:anti-sigma factor RsiW